MNWNLKEDAFSRTLIAAHCGVAGGDIPGNTLEAFDTALCQGADMIELGRFPYFRWGVVCFSSWDGAGFSALESPFERNDGRRSPKIILFQWRRHADAEKAQHL